MRRFLLTVAGLLFAGCGSGGLNTDTIGNIPGPYPVTIRLSVDFPREPEGARFWVLLKVNEQNTERVMRDVAGSGSQQTDLTREFRPGHYRLRAELAEELADDKVGKVVRETTTEFVVVKNERPPSVNLRL